MKRNFITLAAVGLLATAFVASDRRVVVKGECRPVNGADICVWGEKSGNALVAFGATIPMAAITNAPADAPMVWPPVSAAAIPFPTS